MMNRVGMKVFWTVAMFGGVSLFLLSCTTVPKEPPRTLAVTASLPAQVTLRSGSLSMPILLGETPIKLDRITVENSILEIPLRKGGETKSTTVELERLRKVVLGVAATRNPHLHARKNINLPPWTHDINLGLPAIIQNTSAMGIEFGRIVNKGGAAAAYSLIIQDQEKDLPCQQELTEGAYLFQLRDKATGRLYSGLLELQNSTDEFVRFAYVPVFQRITEEELAEIAKNEREPRMYTTHVDGRNRQLATVWLGSRQSTAAIAMGTEPRNIEVFLDRGEASLMLNGRKSPPRFYVEENKEHLLEIRVPTLPSGSSNTLYGILHVPKLAHKAAALTSFKVALADSDILDIVLHNKVIKKTGVYRAPEDPSTEIQIYELTLGSRRPSGM